MGIRLRIVLPFAADLFRVQSVTDRPGDWGPMYDLVIAEAKGAGELTTVGSDDGGDRGHLRTNYAILAESLLLAKSAGGDVAAVLVWDHVSRGPDDVSENFGRSARKLGLEVFEIGTL